MSNLYTVEEGFENKTVIFVHGINGDYQSTWESPSGFYWPRELSKETGWRTLSVDYDVKTHFGSTMRLIERAKNLLERFAADERIRQSDFALIGHSFGGLLSKEMVRAAYDNSEYKWFLEHLAGVVFAATPHQGSTVAAALNYATKVLGSTVTLGELKANEAHLLSLNDWYRNKHDDLGLRSKVYYETRRTKIGWFRMLRLVNPASANPGIPGITPVPIDGDHVTIVKPQKASDLVFTSTNEFLCTVFKLPAYLSRLPQKVGAFCFKKSDKGIELLLVKTTGKRRTFPKGGTEEGESLQESAEREAWEEGGVRGKIFNDRIGTYVHAKQEFKAKIVEEQAITIFLLLVDELTEPPEKHRDPRWFDVESAKRALAVGRDLKYQKEFERIIDLAVERIESI